MVYQVGDIEDPFSPLPASFLQMNLTNDRERIDTILDKIYNSHTVDGPETSSPSKDASKNCAGAAMKAAVDLLKQVKGKLTNSDNLINDSL